MADTPRRSASQSEAVARIREAEDRGRVPVIGKVAVPPPEQLAYYGGCPAGRFEIIDWPVAVAVAAGHVLASNHRGVLEQIGEALEEA